MKGLLEIMNKFSPEKATKMMNKQVHQKQKPRRRREELERLMITVEDLVKTDITPAALAATDTGTAQETEMSDVANMTDIITGRMREKKEVIDHVMKEKLEAGMKDSEGQLVKEMTDKVVHVMIEMKNLETM